MKSIKKYIKDWHQLLIIGSIGLVVFMYVFVLIIQVISILGPLDHPMFEKKDWKSFQVRYWVVTKEKRIRRIVTIDGTELQKIKHSFSTKHAEGKSTGTNEISLLELTNGEKWNIDFSLPNRIYCAKKEDTYYAYEIILNNTRFHEALRQLCFQHEKEKTPQIKPWNIAVCAGGLGPIQEKAIPFLGELNNDQK
jgi:hypothetical protein